MKQIKEIIEREKQGSTCTEEESAAIKQWIKNTHIVPGSEEENIYNDIAYFLPCEYGEAIDEMEQQETQKLFK